MEPLVDKLFLVSLRCFVIVAVCCCAGCNSVHRRITIRSNPPGATVYVDDHQVGTTPVSSDFVYYGTRRIRLIKDGYETLTTMATIPPPWYQIPPLDFVSENLVGHEIRDERTLDFTLKPQKIVPTNELMSRANNLRNQSRAGIVVGPPAVAPTP